MKEDQGEPHRLITVLHSLNPPPIPIDETPHHPPETNPANRAQLAWEKGGIDLSAQRTKFLIQHQGDDIQFNIDPALLEQVKNASGFVPVIIKMQPLYNVSAFLGMAQPPTAGVTPQGQPG